MGRQSEGNGKATLRMGPRETHRYGRPLESKKEKREREISEAKKKIAELEHTVSVSRRVAASAIALLRPYSVEPKRFTPLRRIIERKEKYKMFPPSGGMRDLFFGRSRRAEGRRQNAKAPKSA
jgi:hypothetical protein